MSPRYRLLATALSIAALTLLAAPVAADARPGGYGGAYHSGGYGGSGYHGGYGSGHYHGGHGHNYFWGGVGIGVGLGFGGFYLGAPWYPASWYYPGYYPGYAVAVPTYPAVASPPEPPAKAAPDPIAYPREGQTPEQTEADRRACDRWAMTQPSAMADASIFHRATLACMEGRGYTVR